MVETLLKTPKLNTGPSLKNIIVNTFKKKDKT